MDDRNIRSRAIYGDEDFWRVRELLVRLTPVAPPWHNWDVRWWDGRFFYNLAGRWDSAYVDLIRLWETGDGTLVGCVNCEHPGDAWIQVDPAYRFLEPEMIAWAETSLAGPNLDGQGAVLEFVVLEYDALRQRLLTECGYRKMPEWSMFRRMHLPARPFPPGHLAAPYLLREVRPKEDVDCDRIGGLLNAAFNRTIHNGPEFQSFAAGAPCYVNELDLVAVLPEGDFAAYAGMTYDAANRVGIFEPVCTHPEHLRKGLASGLMREALHRLHAMGGAVAVVGTGDGVPANALYDSLGFSEAYKAHAWRKEW